MGLWPFQRKKDVLGDRIKKAIRASFGFTPKKIDLYKLALCHKSHSKKGAVKNNERLEFLGDAVLDLVLADFLYERYPSKKEGELTKMRARIVSRECLISIAEKLSVGKEIPVRKQFDLPRETIIGNTLEAIIGAIYYDIGYKRCMQITLQAIRNNIDMDKVLEVNSDYKSMLQEWTQKKKKRVEYRCEEVTIGEDEKKFEATVFIDEEPFGNGRAGSKKNAEKRAAKQAWSKLSM
ncbi:MAG: ribonuclease III [Flavobacteriales bacterium]|nr:ribonuclease III [Flavobacteriales bacterium]